MCSVFFNLVFLFVIINITTIITTINNNDNNKIFLAWVSYLLITMFTVLNICFKCNFNAQLKISKVFNVTYKVVKPSRR